MDHTRLTATRLVHIQYLRGIAAMLVVLHHALGARANFFRPFETKVDFGTPGVLIFFIISGFVMMHACRQESVTDFARRRVIRVVPLYWIMTLIFFVDLVPNDVAAGAPFRRVDELIQSMQFIPHYHMAVPDQIWPVLVQGWTLNYEMFFFGLFALGIASGRPAVVTSALLITLVVLGWVFPSDNALLETWTNEFLLLFVAGIGLAVLWNRMTFSALAWAFPLGLALVVLSACKLLPEALITPTFFVAAIVTVVGTLGLQDKYPDAALPLLAKIGDASYSIYLSHTIAMIFLYKGLAALPLSGWAQFLVVLPISLVVCALVGIAIYHTIERPIIARFRRKTRPPAEA